MFPFLCLNSACVNNFIYISIYFNSCLILTYLDLLRTYFYFLFLLSVKFLFLIGLIIFHWVPNTENKKLRHQFEVELAFAPGRYLGEKTDHLILVKDWDDSKLGFISSVGLSPSSSPLFLRYIPSGSQLKLPGVSSKALFIFFNVQVS